MSSSYINEKNRNLIGRIIDSWNRLSNESKWTISKNLSKTLAITTGLITLAYTIKEFHHKWDVEQMNARHIEFNDSIRALEFNKSIKDQNLLVQNGEQDRSIEWNKIINEIRTREEDSNHKKELINIENERNKLRNRELDQHQLEINSKLYNDINTISYSKNIDYTMLRISRLDSLSDKIQQCLDCLLNYNTCDSTNWEDCRRYLYSKVYSSPYLTDTILSFYNKLIDSTKNFIYNTEMLNYLRILQSSFLSSTDICKQTLMLEKADSNLFLNYKLNKNNLITFQNNIYDIENQISQLEFRTLFNEYRVLTNEDLKTDSTVFRMINFAIDQINNTYNLSLQLKTGPGKLSIKESENRYFDQNNLDYTNKYFEIYINQFQARTTALYFYISSTSKDLSQLIYKKNLEMIRYKND